MSERPEVTVVVPTRDRWELLAAHSLPSALGQEGVTVEVVVVDDGSVDGTHEALAAWDDDRLRPLRHERSRGVAASRNAGIAAARGEWVAFLDDDDLWAPRKLRAQLDAAGGAGWSYTGVVVVDERLEPIDELPVVAPDTVHEALRHGNVVPGGGSSVVVRRELLRAVGGFDEDLVYAEDWDLWLRLAGAAPAGATPDLLVATLDHSQRALFRDRRAVQASVAEVLRRSGGTRGDRRSAAEWIANEHHRAGRRGQAALLYLEVALRFRSPGNVLPALGALLGARGLRAVARATSALGRGSQVDVERSAPATPPPWLASARAAAVSARARARTGTPVR